MAKTDVAAPNNTALATFSDMEQDANAGFDGMTQDDFALPFLRLLSSTSPEVGTVEGALPGMFYNTVTGDMYPGSTGITVVPCAYIRQYVEWEPRGAGNGAPVAIYPATSDILTKTRRDQKDNKDYLENGNYIENTANHYVMLVDENGVPSPALITMKATQLKKSRKWNSMMQSVKMKGKNGLFTPPMYSQLYKLTSTAESNDKGKWFGWEIERIGGVESLELYQSCKAFAQAVMEGKVKAKHDAEGEGGAGHAAPF